MRSDLRGALGGESRRLAGIRNPTRKRHPPSGRVGPWAGVGEVSVQTAMALHPPLATLDPPGGRVTKPVGYPDKSDFNGFFELSAALLAGSVGTSLASRLG